MHFGYSEEHADRGRREFVSGIARDLRATCAVTRSSRVEDHADAHVHLFGFSSRNPSGGTVRLSDHS